MESKYMYYMIFATFIATVGQILLKISTKKTWKIKIREYLNIYVIIAYLLIVCSMFINIYSYKGVRYQVGIIIGALGYIFIIILGKIILKENLNKGKIYGCLLIILGVIVYSFGF